jgi:hypothetical protein
MKPLTFILALLFVIGCVAFVWGQQPTTQEQPKKSEQVTKQVGVEKTLTSAGEIVSFDSTASTITVKEKSGKSETFKIDPKVTVKKAGKAITLKDLSAGEKIRVGYKTEAGEKVATWIGVVVQHEKKEHAPKK